jgi:hypothetical protein
VALLTISGEPASRFEEVAHGVAQLLRFELVAESRITQWIAEEFGDAPVPVRAWGPAVASIVARMATEHHLVVALPGAESLFDPMPQLLRAGIVASEMRRSGNVMLDLQLERGAAKAELAKLDGAAKRLRRARFGRSTPRAGDFDITLNAESMTLDKWRRCCALPPPRVASPSRACCPKLPRPGFSSALAWISRGMEWSRPAGLT